MKIKNLLLAILLLTGFSSCTNDEKMGSEGENTLYETYLSLKFESSQQVTRTEGPNAPDTDGSTITNAVVYLTKDGKVVSSHTANVTNLKTDVIGVPQGSYRLYVVANPNSSTPNLSTGADINSLISGVTKENAKKGFMDGNFLMATLSNTTNMVANAGTAVTITSANGVDNPVHVAAKVDRIASKVVDKTGEKSVNLEGEITTIKNSDGSAFFGTTVDFKGYVLVNGNTQFNQIQQWKAGTGSIVGTYVNTPSNAYYSPFTDFAQVDVDPDSKEVTAITDLTATGVSPFTTGDTFTIENCPPFIENNKLTAGAGQTTGVIYKAVANGGVTFYYVGGVVYTDLQKVNELSEFQGVDLTSLSIAELRAKGVRVYQDGVMYYTYFIQDQNYTVSYNGTETKYYNVLRNSVYNLTVNKVTFIGDDVPGGGKVTPEKPNPPIDPDQVFLDVTVTINPWVLNNIDIDF